MVLKRITAYLIDCFIVFLYAVLLFTINYFIHKLLDKPFDNYGPISGQVISFFSLTLPVFIYFYLLESNPKKKGSIGKWFMKLEILNNSRRNVLIRVFFKLLPWEIAHLGIHWSTYYYSIHIDPPLWVWMVNIVPYIIVLVYLLSIFFSKGATTVYDRIANTEIRKEVDT